MQIAISTTKTTVVVTREAILIEEATDGMVDDVTDKDEDGKIEEGNVVVDDGAIEDATDGVVGDITDDERTMEDDADSVVEKDDGIVDDGVMAEATDREPEDDTDKEDEMK